MIPPEILAILCCPETHQSLRAADGALIESLNQEISTGQLRNRTGSNVTVPINGGLIREDGKFLYPLRNNLPILLIDEALPLVD